MDRLTKLYIEINDAPPEAFPDGAQWYDEGVEDFELDRPMHQHGSRSYKDGYRDAAAWHGLQSDTD